VRIWDAATGEQLQEMKGHTGGVASGVSYSPDGKTLASASYDNTVRIWDAATGEQLQEIKGHVGSVESVSYSPDGNTLASASWDKTVRVWGMESYRRFLASKKPTPLLHTFAQAVRFLWQVERDGLEFKRKVIPTLKPQDGYPFMYDKKFRPLLDPPSAGQTKYDQVLAWAHEQVAQEAKSPATDK
jgi:WD40 repeat protein